MKDREIPHFSKQCWRYCLRTISSGLHGREVQLKLRATLNGLHGSILQEALHNPPPPVLWASYRKFLSSFIYRPHQKQWSVVAHVNKIIT
jgi:hypothetical protein